MREQARSWQIGTMSHLARLPSVLAVVTACSSDPVDPTADWVPNTGPPAHVVGHAFVFGPNDGNLPIEGAVVSVAEDPAAHTAVAADGSFELDVASGGAVSFSLTQTGFHPNQSAAIDITSAGIAMLGFQTPTEDTFQTLGQVARVTPDDTRCQISTTVSRKGTEPYGGTGLGVEGVEVAIDPPAAGIDGPIYFAYESGTIFPSRDQVLTSLDGGVIFANVPVGEYTLIATKAGTSFSSPVIRCRAGVLVNAAPPNGIQEQ